MRMGWLITTSVEACANNDARWSLCRRIAYFYVIGARRRANGNSGCGDI